MSRKLPEGTILGTVECPGCGRELPLKENRAGGVYYFCAAPLEWDENGKVTDKCMTRFNYGRSASNRIINEYLAQENENNAEGIKTNEVTETGEHGQPGEPDTITDSGEAGASEQWIDDDAGSKYLDRKGGIAAGLKHFFTADE